MALILTKLTYLPKKVLFVYKYSYRYLHRNYVYLCI
nr:MAG TPA: hypothetical protein [Caudoviricetes sp.]